MKRLIVMLSASVAIGWCAFWLGHLEGFRLARAANEPGALLVLERLHTAASKSGISCEAGAAELRSALETDMKIVLQESESARTVSWREIVAAPIALPSRAHALRHMLEGLRAEREVGGEAPTVRDADRGANAPAVAGGR